MMTIRFPQPIWFFVLAIAAISAIDIALINGQQPTPADRLPAPAWQQPLPAELPPGIEVLGRGPIHEAFAEPIAFDPGAPALIVPRQPPEMVREVPPDNRPEGVDVQWIPGYWSWDDDRQDFIWISGIWRDVPPGRRWIPGYWSQVENGYQWFSGSWIESAQAEVAFLPPPPDSLENGPASPPPGDQYSWVPGCWRWIDVEQAYVWQPGCWQMQPMNMVWVPAHYCYSPQGAIFISAYQDYPFAQRGVMFAPMWYGPSILARPNFIYCPSYQLELAQISSCLFVQPRYCHYYFGDYFGNSYRNRGYYPCHSYSVAYRGYDPIFGYIDGRSSRGHRAWSNSLIRQFDRYVSSPADRPVPVLNGSLGHKAGPLSPSRQLARQLDANLTRTDLKSLSKPQRVAALQGAKGFQSTAHVDSVSNLGHKDRNTPRFQPDAKVVNQLGQINTDQDRRKAMRRSNRKTTLNVPPALNQTRVNSPNPIVEQQFNRSRKAPKSTMEFRRPAASVDNIQPNKLPKSLTVQPNTLPKNYNGARDVQRQSSPKIPQAAAPIRMGNPSPQGNTSGFKHQMAPTRQQQSSAKQSFKRGGSSGSHGSKSVKGGRGKKG